MREVKIAEGMITDGPRRFRGKAASPISRMKAIGDFQFLGAVDDLKEETAITNEAVVLPRNDRKLARQSFAVTRLNFLKKSRRLFPGKNAE